MHKDINVNVSGPVSAPATYKTVILKPNMVDGVNLLTQEMMNSVNTKYVIKHDFVLTKNVVDDSVNVLSTNISQCVNPAYANALAAYNEAHNAWIDADNAYTNDPNETTLAAKNAAYAVYNAAQTTLNNTPQYYFYASKSISIKKHNHIELSEGAVLLNSTLNGTIEFDVASSDMTVYIGSIIPGTYNYTINNAIVIPSGCLIEFDGGSISDGTVIGNNTILIFKQSIDDVMKNVQLDGAFSYSIAEDKPAGDGMGRVILTKDKDFAEQLVKGNTIYIIQYDFDLNGDVTIPANCILEFDGGSLSGGSLVLNNTTFIINNDSVFKNCHFISGELLNKSITTKWFDRESYDNDYEFLNSVFSLNEIGNGGKEIHIYGNYFVDIFDYTPDTSLTINNQKLFLFHNSVSLIGHKATITIVRNGEKYLYDEVLDGKNRGLFAFNPKSTETKAEVYLTGLKLDGGVIDELPVNPNQNKTLGRGLVAFRPGYDGFDGSFKNIIIENCEFTKSICETLNGMGLFWEWNHNTVICKNCYFHDTSGAAYNINARSCIENCFFKNVVAGGAFELGNSVNSVSVIKDCTIIDVDSIASFLTNYGETPTQEQINSIQFRMVNCNCKNTSEFNLKLINAGAPIHGVGSTGACIVTVDSCRFENYRDETHIRGPISFNDCVFVKGRVATAELYSSYYNHCKFYLDETYAVGFATQVYTYNRVQYNDCMFIATGKGSKNFPINIPLSFEGILSVKASSSSPIGSFTCTLEKWNSGSYTSINKTNIEDTSLYEEKRNYYKFGDPAFDFQVKSTTLSIVTNDDVSYTIRLIINLPYNNALITYGSTANRPQTPPLGFQYFDTTLNKPIFYKGSGVWVDATGATV